jgi:hypothetical protein
VSAAFCEGQAGSALLQSFIMDVLPNLPVRVVVVVGGGLVGCLPAHLHRACADEKCLVEDW